MPNSLGHVQIMYSAVFTLLSDLCNVLVIFEYPSGIHSMVFILSVIYKTSKFKLVISALSERKTSGQKQNIASFFSSAKFARTNLL